MKFHDHQANRHRLAARCGGVVLTMVCGISQARADERVIPLVIPLVVPESTDRADASPTDPDVGHTGVPGTDEVADAAPGFDGPTDLPNDTPSGTPGLVLPLMGEDQGFDVPMPDDPDAGWIDMDENPAPETPAANDMLALFDGRSPALSDSWLSGFDPGGGLFSAGSPIDRIRRGIGLALSVTGTYDSNPSRGYTGEENDGTGDFSLMLGGGVSYLSRTSTWTYGASYTGGYRMFFNQSELSGYSQNAAASLNYSGGPLTASFRVGVNFGSGANRNFESVTDSLSVSYGLSARYQISAKTTVQSDFSQSFTLASGQGNLDTGSFDAGLSALWKYSPLTEFGPGIRYTRLNQEAGPTRTTIGPTFLVNYQLTRKVSLNSRVGMDFVSIDGGGSQDPSFSSSVGLNYRASALWGMNLSLLRDSRASNTASGQFDEVTALRLGYTRNIRRASWNLGIGWESSSVGSNASGAADSPDRGYFAIDTSIGMPVFYGTTQARVFCGYRDENGGTFSSDSFQAGFGLSRDF